MTDAPTEREGESGWAKLRRRKVVQWGLAYAATGWTLLQALEYAVETFHWPEPIRQLATIVVGVRLVDREHYAVGVAIEDPGRRVDGELGDPADRVVLPGREVRRGPRLPVRRHDHEHGHETESDVRQAGDPAVHQLALTERVRAVGYEQEARKEQEVRDDAGATVRDEGEGDPRQRHHT